MSQRVLVIEDDVFLGDLLLEKLNKEGYDTHLVRDGALGIPSITQLKPDIILLDIILPNVNGYEILEAKRKDPNIAAIPVIVISNSGQPVEVSRVLALGVKDYLIKARFDVNDVIYKMREVLGQGQPAVQPSITSSTEQKATGGVPQDQGLSGKHLLWVEDDKFLGDILSRKLTAQGAIVYRAKNADEAYASIEKDIPDMILLDVILPGADGFEILQKVKISPRTKQVPVIMLSNVSQSGEIEKSKLLGAHKFLVKAAVTLDQIIREIKTVLA